MEFRELGKTGMKASVIGLGPEHLVGKPYEQIEEVIHACLDGGVNIMDLFMPQEDVRKDIGKALKSRSAREKMIIQGHIGSALVNNQFGISRDMPECKRLFENYLETLGTDYIDIGTLFFIDSEEDYTKIFDGGLADYALDLKKKGVIRAIGASSHNPIMAAKAISTGIIDVLMFSINPAFDLMPAERSVFDVLDGKSGSDAFVGVDPKRTELYRLCASRGVGITVMKTLGAGKLISKEQTPFKKPLTVGQCIHFALTRPAVASVLIGCVTRGQVGEALRYLELSDSERDYTEAISGYQRDFAGNCVYCNHCLPCPSGIDIASVTKYLDIARLDTGNIPDSIRSHYKSLAHKASECIKCKSCESICPFNVDITGNMDAAAGIFGE